VYFFLLLAYNFISFEGVSSVTKEKHEKNREIFQKNHLSFFYVAS